ncbi:hypothetical protein O1611_g785 [Lasiodiplodia mahajangana]|uniref:Uncharacterized protein n=1 Tax=Lasiodiplodia mahajangana TaxID=1108764 RepID=A0ACC2JZE8_9PEZI|nr:hypothetical protein O1611_g785 [Lasiodiplodia mahajangana]
MEHSCSDLCNTVFRVRGLPHTIKTIDDVANLVAKTLGDISAHDIRVFSLATNLGFGDNSPSRVATLMFDTGPSITRDSQSKNEWEIPIGPPEPGHCLILDTHFKGMTPMNDVKHLSHKYDCIAISGLASHPFGSWQPKASPKTFMWIRDALPKHICGIRSVIYGYETKLAGSQSFERIPDLSSGLIALLMAYGWGSQSSKPVVFLAHSLGGLVLRDALRRIGDGSAKEYKMLWKNLRGALFFGVPNLGMEQACFRAIVQNNPNDTLIDDIGRGSNYLRELNERLSHNLTNTHFKQFWAYETLESPTVTRASDGNINRSGPRAILVSPESATLKLIHDNPSATFPIKATHSDMVKFTRESPDYHIVISKILSIANDELNQDYLHTGHQPVGTETDRGPLFGVTEEKITAEVQVFRRLSGITLPEATKFLDVTSGVIRATAAEIQMIQEEKEELMYMGRLEPILISMEQFAEVSKAIGATFGLPNPMAYVWGPMEFILRATYSYSDIFNYILDAYQQIGEKIPQFAMYREQLVSNQHFKHALALIYSDILWFHREVLQQLKQREWKKLFTSTWGNFTSCCDQIQENIARSHRLIRELTTRNISLKEFEEIQSIRASSLYAFRANRAVEDASRRETVMQWLSPWDCEAQQARHRRTRSICESPGKWLLVDSCFSKWSAPEFCPSPCIWLNGIPGAGKTILASIAIDHLQREEPDAAVAYFYCKHGDDSRNSFISVARAVLSQLLRQRPHLLSYLFEKASTSGHVLLDSTTAREVIQTVLSISGKTYIVVDGVDECARIERDEIAETFRTSIENLPEDVAGSVRCLFVSQDDDNAGRNFRDLPTIKIADRSQGDLRDFAEKRQNELQTKFGAIDYRISEILVARARGMFIFADLFSKYLESQLSKAALLAELDPNKLPVSLDHVYERIFERVFEMRNDTSGAFVREILGWIACARRPLKWAEVQGAVCIDLDNQVVDYARMLSESPKGLFASLIEIGKDGTVELIHETAREYICRNIIKSRETNYSLAIVCLGYLTMPQLDIKGLKTDGDVAVNVANGTYCFYDYASACWAMHLQEGISGLQTGSELSQLLEILETFMELHWSRTHKPLQDLKRSSRYGQGPSADEALDLWQVTEKIRSALEDTYEPRYEEADLQRFYGRNRFKCPRVNCLRYYQGFSTLERRQHHLNKHDRPFLCYIVGCHMEVFGYATAKDLKKHLFKYHGIDNLDDTADAEFPDPPKRKAMTEAKREAAYECSECGKKFTRNHNLQNHIRSHQGLRPFGCQVCGQTFTRKPDCDRHERGHGEGKYICIGSLKTGETWGCKRGFSRLDSLASHFQSKKGKRCIKPHMQERMEESGNSDGLMNDTNPFGNQTGENADALRAAGNLLPPFQEFLQLCGLAPPAIDP